MKSRRRRDRGDICQLRVELWAGIRAASAMVEDPETAPELKLRAVSALATAASVYAKLLEAQPDDDVKPETPGDIIVIRSATGNNGHHG
jgi:hypothetical protein